MDWCTTPRCAGRSEPGKLHRTFEIIERFLTCLGPACPRILLSMELMLASAGVQQDSTLTFWTATWRDIQQST
jgi:hypothetical protein